MSKYKNKKTEIDGIMFDSKAESEYYLLLVGMKARREILDFTLQPKFVLLEGFRKNGKKWQPITYKADFSVLHTNGETEIIDIKGGKLTKDFALKRKMFESKHEHLSLKLLKKGKSGFIFHESN